MNSRGNDVQNNRDGFKLIHAGKLIDGRGGPSTDAGAVLLEGSKIVAVGRQGEVVAPNGSRVELLDYSDKTVMPGMVDTHTHHVGFGDGRVGDEIAAYPDEILTLQAAKNARRALFSGVTTIRENGPKNMTMFRLRDSVNMGLTLGPRMHLCGRPISIIGGHMGYFGSEVTGPIEARAMARQLIKEGADYLKITATGGSTGTSFQLLPAFNVDELQAITDEAHKFGKPTAAHCLSTQGIANALEAEVDMIIHCVFKHADGTNNFDEAVAERIVKQCAYINPTLHVFRSRIWILQRKKERDGLTTEEQTELDSELREFDVRIDNCRRLIEMGGKVITGSDSSWGNYILGNTAYETETLVMSGYSNEQGVYSVTGDAARSLDMDDKVGTLEAGKEADLLVLDGDPTKDIKNLWKVADVFLRGQSVDRGSEKSIAAVRQQPPENGI
jgi:imidazolonepropionase-like amidohydrolase